MVFYASEMQLLGVLTSSTTLAADLNSFYLKKKKDLNHVQSVPPNNYDLLACSLPMQCPNSEGSSALEIIPPAHPNKPEFGGPYTAVTDQ